MAKALGQVVQFLQILCPLSPEKPLPLPWGLEAFQSYVACIVSGQGTIVPIEIEMFLTRDLGLKKDSHFKASFCKNGGFFFFSGLWGVCVFFSDSDHSF